MSVVIAPGTVFIDQTFRVKLVRERQVIHQGREVNGASGLTGYCEVEILLPGSEPLLGPVCGAFYLADSQLAAYVIEIFGRIEKSYTYHSAVCEQVLSVLYHQRRECGSIAIYKYDAVLLHSSQLVISIGEQAVGIVAENPDIDMIFMDILMPVKSGLDATIELRQKKFQGIIIACTANNDEADFAQYRQQGMNDIIIKPFKKDVIRATLEKWKAVLSVPEAKQIMTLVALKNKVEDMWDITLFMDTIGNDNEKAQDNIDFKLVVEKSDKLMELCDFIKSKSLVKMAKEISDAAGREDKIATESADLNFSIDFVQLENITTNWRNSL